MWPALRRRTRLLDAAAELISEQGTVHVPLSEIVARAKCNQALVKYHYGNKEGLLVALLSRDAGAGVRRLHRLLELDVPTAEKFRMHIAGTVRTYAEYPYWNRLMHFLIAEGTPEAREKVRKFLVEPVIEFHTALLAQGVKEGAFKPIDPIFFHLCIQGTCDQLFSARSSLRYGFGKEAVDEAMRKRFVDQITDLLLTGLMQPKRSGARPSARARKEKK